MSRHGKPDSRMWNLLRSFQQHAVVTIVVPVVVGVSAALVYGVAFGADQAVENEHRLQSDKELSDAHSPVANFVVDRTPGSWASWLSAEQIDIPPGQVRGYGKNGFPGDARAESPDMPYTHDMQTSQVASSFAFTLTGVRNKPVRITKIEAVVDSREPLPEGTVYYAIPQGAVGREDFAIDFGSDDLDARAE